jgi:hypothetical protein
VQLIISAGYHAVHYGLGGVAGGVSVAMAILAESLDLEPSQLLFFHAFLACKTSIALVAPLVKYLFLFI